MKRTALRGLIALAVAVAGGLFGWLGSSSSSRWVALPAAALGGALGWFAPVIQGWLKGRDDARAAAAALQEDPPSSPAALLDPRREVVAFTGREQEFADLLGWCRADAPAVSARLITGPAGVGKTRLALELQAQLGSGWRSTLVRDGKETVAVTDARAVTRGPVLLVVDSAETRSGLKTMLEAAMRDSGPLRILLLARGTGDWWERLFGAEPDVIAMLAEAQARALPLAPVLDPGASDEDIVRAAVPAFARALGVEPPASVPYIPAPGPYRARILDLHAAALLAVLEAERDTSGAPVPVGTPEVIAQLLGYEQRYWIGSAEVADMMAGPDAPTIKVLRRIVAAGSLLGAGSETEAVTLLHRVPGSPATVKVATWLHDLYPPDTEGDWLGSLRPDRLAEYFVVHELGESPGLAAACLVDLDDRQVERALTVLGRAAQEATAAQDFLAKIVPALDHVASDPAVSSDRLERIAGAIPWPSPLLALADEAITRRVLDAIPADGASPKRATWLFRYSSRLAQVNRVPESIAVSEQAIALDRELVKHDPAGYQPLLARTLANFGAQLLVLGDRLKDALNAEEEAFSIYRDLAKADPGRYRPLLATVLVNAGMALRAAGALSKAAAVTTEAVTIRRDLAKASPFLYRPPLASALVNLGAMLAEQDHPADALKLEQEAYAIYQDVALVDPGLYQPGLAMCAFNIGNRFTELGDFGKAVRYAQEAADIRRELAQADPGAYRYPFARALSLLGIVLTDLGQPADAFTARDEAVAVYRALAKADADRYNPQLADSLSDLAATLSALDRQAEAATARTEAAPLRAR